MAEGAFMDLDFRRHGSEAAQGGDDVWGDEDGAPDDPEDATHSSGALQPHALPGREDEAAQASSTASGIRSTPPRTALSRT